MVDMHYFKILKHYGRHENESDDVIWGLDNDP